MSTELPRSRRLFADTKFDEDFSDEGEAIRFKVDRTSKAIKPLPTNATSILSFDAYFKNSPMTGKSILPSVIPAINTPQDDIDIPHRVSPGIAIDNNSSSQNRYTLCSDSAYSNLPTI